MLKCILLTPRFIDTGVEDFGLGTLVVAALDEKVDTYAHRNSEDIGIRDLQSLSGIPTQIQNVDCIEIGSEMFSQPVKRHIVNKTIVGYECDNAFCFNPI